MILPDVNVLVYAYNTDASQHTAVRQWWEQTLTGRRTVGLAWTTIIGFIRVATNPKASAKPKNAGVAVAHVRSWLAAPTTQIIMPGNGHAETLFGLIERVGTAGNLTSDAHLAALAIEYDAEIATTDADFTRFAGVRWFNPAQ